MGQELFIKNLIKTNNFYHFFINNNKQIILKWQKVF